MLQVQTLSAAVVGRSAQRCTQADAAGAARERVQRTGQSIFMYRINIVRLTAASAPSLSTQSPARAMPLAACSSAAASAACVPRWPALPYRRGRTGRPCHSHPLVAPKPPNDPVLRLRRTHPHPAAAAQTSWRQLVAVREARQQQELLRAPGSEHMNRRRRERAVFLLHPGY